MLKLLLLLAFTVHTFVLASSKGNYRRNSRSFENKPSCSNNEKWVPCPEAVCAPKTCEDVGFPIPCFDFNSKSICPSRPRCICKEGFVRNYRGNCIPIEFCHAPIRCKRRNEVYDPCPSPCPARTCGINDAAVSCAPTLPKGHPDCPPPKCRCRDGFYRNHVGNCVLWKNCPTCKRLNEIYDPCPAPCPERACGVDKALILCQFSPQLGDPECKPGCRCMDGFVKNQNGICIPEDECPPQCPSNEVSSNCIQGNCSPQNCSQVGFSVPCPRIDPRFCKKGCLCKEGHVRDNNGICIPSSECPLCGGDRNKVAGCGVYCNQRCKNIGMETEACIEVCYDNACGCRKGYYLDDNTGFCVLPKHCTRPCLENEWYSECTQGDCNPQTCSQLGSPVACPSIDSRYCKKGCLCKEGYVRNNKGFCIPSSECPRQCRENEWYSECTQGDCNPQTCSQLGIPLPCPSIDSRYCKKGCLCKEGYVRNNEGDCIPSSECPPICPENEWYSECTQSNCRPENCTQVGFPLACPAVDPDYCKKGCLCIEGYARNNKGICIPTNKCPRQCRENEWYSECTQGDCNPQTCSQLGIPLPCPSIDSRYCKKGCLCKEGYVRNNEGDCIHSSECPQQCPKNEWYSECTQGECNPQTCSQLGIPLPCPSIDSRSCKTGCLCREGYVRNNKGVCIPSSECPPICPENEWYSECTQSNCRPENCTQVGFPLACPAIDPDYCKQGCLCKEGYARNNKGICIPSNKCPDTVCGQNEIYEDCSNPVCEAEYCTELGFVIDCSLECRKGCICKDGYVRDDKERCIPIEKCPSCGGDPNAVSGCGVNCGRRCSNIDNNEPVACSTICRLNGCDCKEGFYYDDITEKCVRPEDCAPKCPMNERYEECPGSSCEPQYCDELGYSSSCSPQPADGSCSTKPGCVCVDGYVRDKNEKCIQKNQCPSCGDDRNALSGCGVNCGKRCRDLVKAGGACIKICNVNACDCKDGFYFDSYQNKCVLANQCTDICGKNEVFEDCSDPICRAKNCFQIGFPLNCNDTCIRGCVCQNGYVRNNNGICIPIKNCPSCGGDPNAQSGCGYNCGKRCPNNYVNPKFCPRIACVLQLNKCDCRDGFYYDVNTESCVKLEDCSPSCDASNNEVYDSCLNGGCGWRYCSQVGSPMLCIDPIKCYNKGCKCKDRYFRLDNGTCVRENMCPNYTPSCDASKNEVYDSCVNGGCGWRNCSQVGGPMLCIDPVECYKGCKCKDGYYRLDNGTCVAEKMCPNYSSCGGDPNAQPGCGYNCGKRCPNNYRNPKLCPKQKCVPNKCDCKDGFYYDINIKRCVRFQDCYLHHLY